MFIINTITYSQLDKKNSSIEFYPSCLCFYSISTLNHVRLGLPATELRSAMENAHARVKEKCGFRVV